MDIYPPLKLAPLLALCACQAFGRPTTPSASDIASYERGFASSCAAGFPHASAADASATCRCMLKAMYADDSPEAVLPRMRDAGKSGIPADLEARVMAARATCAGGVLEAEYAAGCVEGCAEGCGDDCATIQSTCDTLCGCLITTLHAAHPGDAGRDWMVANAWGAPTAAGEAELAAARTTCSTAAGR